MAVIEARSRRLLLHVPLHVSENAAGSRSELTKTVDVSGTGVAFDLPYELPVGTRLDLAFDLPEHLRAHFGGHATYRVKAVVTRLEHVEGAPRFRTAARFVAGD